MKMRSFPLAAVALMCLLFAGPAWSAVLYTNGSESDLAPGFGIAYYNAVSDSFTLPATSNLAQALVALQVPDYESAPTQVSWSIGTQPFGHDVASGTATNLGSIYVTQISGNFQDYDVYNCIITLSGSQVGAGAYWLTLQDETLTNYTGWASTASGASQGQYGNTTSVPFSPNNTTYSQYFQLSGTSSPVPVPPSALLLGSGLVGLVARARKKFFR